MTTELCVNTHHVMCANTLHVLQSFAIINFRLQNIICLVRYIHIYYLGVKWAHINNTNITSCSLYNKTKPKFGDIWGISVHDWGKSAHEWGISAYE